MVVRLVQNSSQELFVSACVEWLKYRCTRDFWFGWTFFWLTKKVELVLLLQLLLSLSLWETVNNQSYSRKKISIVCVFSVRVQKNPMEIKCSYSAKSSWAFCAIAIKSAVWKPTLKLGSIFPAIQMMKFFGFNPVNMHYASAIKIVPFIPDKTLLCTVIIADATALYETHLRKMVFFYGAILNFFIETKVNMLVIMHAKFEVNSCCGWDFRLR